MKRLLHLYRNLASHLMKKLHELGVSTIYLGYPFNIAQDKGNKFTVNMWSYNRKPCLSGQEGGQLPQS